ncbi:MAG: hypothetical protein WCQ99_07140 [Pseudomonadota bacterium]
MGAGAIPIDIEKAFKQRQQSSHKLKIYTAPFAYEGEDRVDVSFNGGNFVLTPPRSLLFDYRLGRVSPEKFQDEYCRFLESSFIQHLYSWERILESGKIVLVCSCNAGDAACHRHVLINFLKRLGGIYCGEVTENKKKHAAPRP